MVTGAVLEPSVGESSGTVMPLGRELVAEEGGKVTGVGLEGGGLEDVGDPAEGEKVTALESGPEQDALKREMPTTIVRKALRTGFGGRLFKAGLLQFSPKAPCSSQTKNRPCGRFR